MVARNILKLIAHAKQPNEPAPELEKYAPSAPAIKVSLGLVRPSVCCSVTLLIIYLQSQAVYQVDGVVGRKTGVPEDLETLLLWKFYGFDPTEETMHT